MAWGNLFGNTGGNQNANASGGDPNQQGNGNQANNGQNNQNGNGGQNNGQQPQNNQGGNNNNGPQLDQPLNIWEDPKSKELPQAQPQAQPPQAQQPDSKTRARAYVDGLDFTQNVDMAALNTALQNGDMGGVSKTINQMLQNSAFQMMMDTGKMLESAVKSSVDTAVNQSRTNYSADQMVQQMFTKHEYMKDPDMAPVARSVLAQALKRGMSQEEAIGTVHKHFTRAANLVSGSAGGNSGKSDLNGNSQFGGGPRGENLPTDFWNNFLLGENVE